MGNKITPLRGLLGAVLVVSAILFVIGTSIERSKSHTETAVASSTESASHKATESGSTESGTSTEAGHQKATPATHSESTHSSEKLFGINIESIPTIAMAAAASLILAALVVWRRERMLLVVVVLFGLLFAAGDARELTHQLNEHRSGLAALAGVLIALHLIVSGLAAFLVREPDRRQLTAEATPTT